MRILASTGPLFTRPLDWALGVLAEAGYDGVELMVTRDPDTQSATRIATLAAQEGVAVPVVHGPFLLLTRRVLGTDLVDKARRSLDLAGAVGADLLVVHPPLRWQGGFQRWLVAQGDAEAADHGTRLGVENLYPVTVRGHAARLHHATLPEHLLPHRDVVLDTSHLGVTGVDLVAAYTRLRDHVVHLHVSDNRGSGHDSHAPLGAGVLPIARFLRTIADDERDGRGRVGEGASITLELDCRPHVEDRAQLVAYLRDELRKCRALLDGADAEEVLGRPDDVAVPAQRPRRTPPGEPTPAADPTPGAAR